MQAYRLSSWYTICKRTLLLLLIVSISSCGKGGGPKASYGSAYLEEANALLEAREFTKAEERALEALKFYNEAIEIEPKNVDFLLVRSRIYFTLFLSKNILILERAPEDPQSTVKIPEVWEYMDYDSTLGMAEKDLKAVLNDSENITYEQLAAARGMLGNIYRLDKAAANLANEQLEKSIEATKKWLSDMRNPKSRLESNTLKIMRAEKQIQDLHMARAEVLLMGKQWNPALEALEEAVGGKDLKYFSVQFTLLENKIVSLTNRLEENQKHTENTREGKLLRYIEEARNKKQSSDKFSNYNATELEILVAEMKLTKIKNNLIYRVICYHHLGQNQDLKQAHDLLKSFYPDIDAKLTLTLQQNDMKN